jgi:hypothetical protein
MKYLFTILLTIFALTVLHNKNVLSQSSKKEQSGMLNITYKSKDTYYRVNTDKLFIREKPNVNSQSYDLLVNGAPLKLLENTNISETISGIKGNWIKVETIDSIVGYVFNGFCMKIKIHSVWSIGSNDGNGEADCFFYSDSYYYFSGWKQYIYSKWSMDKSNEMTMSFENNNYFISIIDKISNNINKYKKDWNVKYIDVSKKIVCFYITEDNKSKDHKRSFDFFGYNMMNYPNGTNY